MSEQSPQHLETTEESAKLVVRNSAFAIGADLVVKILSFLFNIYVIRELGDELFGSYTAVLAFTGIFSIIGDLGMTQYAQREIARGRKTADDLFWDMVILRMLLSTLGLVSITAGAAYLAQYNPSMVLGVFIACLSFYVHAIGGPVRVVLVAKERLNYEAVLEIVFQLSFVTVGAIVMLADLTFHALIVATFIGIPFTSYLGMRFIRQLKLADLKFRLNPRTWWGILKASLPFGVITFTLSAANDLDTVLLSLWRDTEEVGWYKAAYNLIFRLTFIRLALINALGPQMARHYGVSKPRVAQTFNFSLKFLWITSIPFAIGTMIIAEPLIIFLYTDEYRNSGILLAILIWSLPLLNISSLFSSITTISDREKMAMRVYIGAAVINLVTNMIAIPMFGYVGAAASTVLTEFVTLFFFYQVIRDEFPITDWWNAIIKPTLAAGLMGLAVLFVHWQGMPLLVTIIVGIVTYPIILLAMRPFSAGETELIQNLTGSIGRKLGLGRK